MVYKRASILLKLFSLNLPLGRFSHRVAMSLCVSVCAIPKNPLPGVGRPLVEERIPNIGLQ